MRTHPKTKEDKAKEAAESALAPPNPHRPLSPIKKYPPERFYIVGDECAVRLCCGRSNGVTDTIMNTCVRVSKSEDSMGIVYVESQLLQDPVAVPACNLQLIRAVEDIPRYAIATQGNGYYITCKGMAEAVAATWFGGKTGVLREDALAAAELILSYIQDNQKDD
jgi:hypothetical protein